MLGSAANNLLQSQPGNRSQNGYRAGNSDDRKRASNDANPDRRRCAGGGQDRSGVPGNQCHGICESSLARSRQERRGERTSSLLGAESHTQAPQGERRWRVIISPWSLAQRFALALIAVGLALMLAALTLWRGP